MNEGSGTAREISLKEVSLGEDFDAMENASLNIFKAVPQVGDEMPDGTKYAGISPDTGKAMYTTPADAPLTYTFNKAQGYAAGLDACGHQDWRIPTKEELNVIFINRAAIGGFNERSYPAGWYWSAPPDDDGIGWVQRFYDGDQYYDGRDGGSSLRCVR